MSVRSMARVWESSQHGGSDLLMLLAIADFADDDGNAYPAVSTLATKCRMKPRNCQYILRALEQSGELTIEANTGPGGSNRYRINFVALGVQHSAGVQSLAGVQHGARSGAKDCTQGVQRIAYEPSVNRQQPSTPHSVHPYEIPDGLDLDSWDRWSTYRKDIRKAIKPASVLAAQRKLAGFGEDQAAVVEQSIANGWQGLFAMKGAAQSTEKAGSTAVSAIKPGATRTRGGIQERFTETMGWVPA